MDDSETAVFVYDSSLKDMAVKAVELCKFKPKVCVMIGEGEVPAGHVSYAKFIEGKPKTAAADGEGRRDVGSMHAYLHVRNDRPAQGIFRESCDHLLRLHDEWSPAQG
jgi:hypothetical protein